MREILADPVLSDDNLWKGLCYRSLICVSDPKFSVAEAAGEMGQTTSGHPSKFLTFSPTWFVGFV